jgi:hypothetical protein
VTAPTLTQTRISGREVFALRRFVYPPKERCEFCRAALGDDHDHLLDLAADALRCACAACRRHYAGLADANYRPVRPHREPLAGVNLSDAQWAAFAIPIDLAGIVRGEGDAVFALYPGPQGLTRAPIDTRLWADVVADAPALGEAEPHVDAILFNRMGGKRAVYRVSIDACYALAGLIRKHWRGLSGGAEVWAAIDSHFSDFPPATDKAA